MRAAPKKTQHKQRTVEGDTYLPRRSPKGILQCTGCGTFYVRRHWTLIPPSGFRTSVHAHPVYCPACRKIRERYPGGEVMFRGLETTDRIEVAKIMRKEESRAREKNPLERIMGLYGGDGEWRVETTTEKLAQRLGRAVHKARGGKLEYKWSHKNKLARVVWDKAAK